MSDVCINKLGRRDVICNHPVRYRIRPSKKSLEPPSTMLPLMIGSHTSDKLPRDLEFFASRSMLRARVLAGVSWLAIVINRSPKQFVSCEPVSYQTTITLHSFVFLSMSPQYLHNQYRQASLSYFFQSNRELSTFNVELIGSSNSGALLQSARWGCGKRVNRK